MWGLRHQSDVELVKLFRIDIELHIRQPQIRRNLGLRVPEDRLAVAGAVIDRKSTRLNSSHLVISYAVFCLKKKKKTSFFSPISSFPIHLLASSPITIPCDFLSCGRSPPLYRAHPTATPATIYGGTACVVA